MSTLKVNNVQDLGADAVVTNGVVAKGALPSGSVLQVVSTTKTDRFTATGASFAAVTGLTASITPTSATNKILVRVDLGMVDASTLGVLSFRLLRNSTAIALGDAAGSRTPVSMSRIPDTSPRTETMSISFLDSPATTSSITYGVDCRAENGTLVVNGDGDNTDSANRARGVSTITVMEIAG